ncbi:MAG: DCC1-like thiol-disulfide oxidoreductase family protein [Verrucomicrobiota bacterium]
MRVATPEIKHLTVLYDGECGLCGRLKERLQDEPVWIELEFLALQNPAVPQRFPGIEAYEPTRHLVIVDDHQGVYCAENAWIMILYATKAFRGLSFELSAPGMKTLAKEACEWVSGNRKNISSWCGLKPQLKRNAG